MDNSGRYLKYFVHPKFYDLLVIQWRKKYAKDPQKGVLRLQKLAESKVKLYKINTDIYNERIERGIEFVCVRERVCACVFKSDRKRE